MAYLLKAKKNIEEQDINEFKVKKEKVSDINDVAHIHIRAHSIDNEIISTQIVSISVE